MIEGVAEERHEEVEQSNAVSDSDADRWQTSRPPTLSGPYYEPGPVEGGGFETVFGQSLARPLLTAIDPRILSASPADLGSSDGRRSSTPPCIPLANLVKSQFWGSYTLTCTDVGEIWRGGVDLVHPTVPNFTTVDAACRPCGAKNIKIGL